jgi:hypothetical protein
MAFKLRYAGRKSVVWCDGWAVGGINFNFPQNTVSGGLYDFVNAYKIQ